MANLMDYIAWRRDVPCSIAPYNDADFYILSKIGTVDYSGIVSPNKTRTQFVDATKKYFAFGRKLGLLSSPYITESLKIIPDSNRYKDVKLTAFRLRFSEEKIEQFSALTLLLPDNTLMVTFRGTDDTLIAWKEDLQMAVKYNVPAQVDAAKYLKYVARFHVGPIIVAGHSKGGNLAVYAASNVSPSIQKKIKAVYSFDGPGFHDSFYSESNYNNIKDRIHEIVPNTSIIGMMLTKESALQIVKAEKSGIASHDGYQWETNANGFIREHELEKASTNLHDATEDVLANMTQEEVSLFIDQLFDALETNGAKTVTEISQQKLSQYLAVLKKLQDDKQVKEFAIEMAKNLIKCVISNR